jgi:putative ABC transport system permease protein
LKNLQSAIKIIPRFLIQTESYTVEASLSQRAEGSAAAGERPWLHPNLQYGWNKMPPSVERQVVLPFGQVVRISFNSMRVRLSRSLITTASLALAIAFVAYIWSGYDILNSVWSHVDSASQEDILSSGYEMIDGHFGTSPKDRWLAILSLLVAVVGIVNAQLMAVTERFREIGTFKCLGALNSFVVRIFVLEGIYQGIFGGFVGCILGILISTFSLTLKLGWSAILFWPPLKMLFTIVWALVLAALLSLLGVMYPALVAARMEPAVALRAE